MLNWTIQILANPLLLLTFVCAYKLISFFPHECLLNTGTAIPLIHQTIFGLNFLGAWGVEWRDPMWSQSHIVSKCIFSWGKKFNQNKKERTKTNNSKRIRKERERELRTRKLYCRRPPDLLQMVWLQTYIDSYTKTNNNNNKNRRERESLQWYDYKHT